MTDPVIIPGSTGDLVNITDFEFTPVYDNFGPSSVSITFTANGYGGLLVQEFEVIPVNIDQTPGLVSVPESRDKFKTEEPVISPEEDSLLTLEVTDIDIPVEIKADKQIKVEIDDNGIWNDVRSI